MCLGVPGQIVERQSRGAELDTALVAFGGITRAVSLALVPEARVGDYVLVHAGVALQTIDAAEAAELLEHLRAIGDGELAGLNEGRDP